MFFVTDNKYSDSGCQAVKRVSRACKTQPLLSVIPAAVVIKDVQRSSANNGHDVTSLFQGPHFIPDYLIHKLMQATRCL